MTRRIFERKPSRRTVLKGAAALAGTAVGTGASAYNDIAAQVKKDLGITLQLAALDSDAVVQRAVTQPKSYEIVDAEYWMLPKIVPSGNLQPMDTKKIKLFDKIVPIFTKGEMPNGKKVAVQGTAPIKVSYLPGKDAKSFSKTPTQWFTLVPTIYNADTLGIRPDLVSEPITQWKQLLDPKYKGKASILNISSIGIMDAAMVCESMGEV